MPGQRKKPENLNSEVILIRVPEALKREVDEMAEDLNVPVAQIARQCLKETVEGWRANRPAKTPLKIV